MPEPRDPPTVIIEPTRGWQSLDLRELVRYRELVWFLAWRDVKVRYKQAVLGALWAILQPLVAMAVFTVVFGRLAGIPSDGVPYPLFAYAALLPWQLFAHALSESSQSLVANRSLVTKVWFPRLAIPLATVIAGLLDFLLALAVFFPLLLAHGRTPGPELVLLPIFALLAAGTALGAGLWLAALNVQYRDVRYVVPFLTQTWMFATPIVYPASLVPEAWRPVFALNPLVGVVEGFRHALLGTPAPGVVPLAVSVLAALGLLGSGALYFRRMERTFADAI